MANVKKIEIKHLLVANKVIFEFEKENNTIKATVIEAVKNGVSLKYADLHGADLGGAVLEGANLLHANLHNANLDGAILFNANLSGAYLRGANLHRADLIGADLSNAFLCGADLCKAKLSNVKLYNANLESAILFNASLFNADLFNADLSRARLIDANLNYAKLRDANLDGADLRGAKLYGADLSGVKNIPFMAYSCPSDGSFIGWKKILRYEENYNGDFLVKLLIPEDARRCSATTDKCRCDKAKVLEITSLETNESVDVITNTNFKKSHCTYKVGEMVYADSFDENRWNECSHGIHFFINKQSAIEYA